MDLVETKGDHLLKSEIYLCRHSICRCASQILVADDMNFLDRCVCILNSSQYNSG